MKSYKEWLRDNHPEILTESLEDVRRAYETISRLKPTDPGAYITFQSEINDILDDLPSVPEVFRKDLIQMAARKELQLTGGQAFMSQIASEYSRTSEDNFRDQIRKR